MAFSSELELTYIIHGKGNRFIGDSIEIYEDGDLVLIGENLPHVWKNDSSYFEGRYDQIAIVNVIQFLPKFFGEMFYGLKEIDSHFSPSIPICTMSFVKLATSLYANPV